MAQSNNEEQSPSSALEQLSVEALEKQLNQLEQSTDNAGTRQNKTELLWLLVNKTRSSAPKESLLFATQMLALMEKEESKLLYGQLLLALVELNTAQDNYVEADRFAEELIGWAIQSERPRFHITGLFRQAVIARAQSNLDEASALLDSAVTLSANEKIDDLTADIFYEKAIISFYLSEHQQGINNIRKSLEMYRASSNVKKEGKALNILAILYGTQGRFKESLEIMMQALDIAQANNDLNAQVSLYSNIALTLDKLEKYEESVDIYQDALKLAKRLGDKSSEALTLVNLGVVYRNLKRYDKAMQTLTQGLTLSKQINTQNISARALSTLSSVARLQDRYESSFDYAQQALTIVAATNNQDVGMSPKRNLAYYYLFKKEFDTALAQLDEFQTWASKKGDSQDVADAFQIRSEIYVAMGDYQQALAHFQQYKSLVDKVFTDKSEEQINTLRAQFEAKEKDITIDKLAQERLLQDEKIAKQNVLIENKQLQRNLIIAAMLLIFAAIFYLYKRRIHKNIELHLEKEVAERTADLNRKNEALNNAYRLVEEKSLTDELTGLKNRRFLIKTLEQDIRTIHEKFASAQSDAEVESENMIFFLIDLDHFKEVNDTYGHAAGDLVLVQISELLNHLFRQTDHVVRWGGEEFLIVVRDAKRDEAPVYAERLRKMISDHRFRIGDQSDIHKTCSVGFSYYPCFKNDAQRIPWTQVVDIADQCLYAAKNSGRDAWVGLDFYENDPTIELFPHMLKSPNQVIKNNHPKLFTSLTNDKAISWQKIA